MDENAEQKEEKQPIHKRVVHHAKRAAPHVKKAGSFLARHATIVALFLVLFMQFMPNGAGTYPWGGMYMRTLNKQLLIADNAAAQSVDNYLRQQASDTIAKQYPNLPDANRAKVIDDSIQQLKKDHAADLANEQKRLAGQIRDAFMYEVNGSKYVYMPDIDPYYYLRYARNLVQTGHKYDILNNGQPWDNHMLAPMGVPSDPSWQPDMLAFIYRVYAMFDPSVPLMEAAGYQQLIFIFLSLICVFFITRKVAGNLGGVFAVTVLAILPSVMGRTPWGHAGHDSYNVFFPLLGVWLIFEALSRTDWKKQTLFAALAGAAIGVYTEFWPAGWWYAFDFIVGALFVAAFLELVMHVKKGKVMKDSRLKKFLVAGATFLVSCAVVATLCIGFNGFVEGGFFGAIHFTSIKNATLGVLWPNVLTTVAELNPGSIDSVLNATGGSLLMAIACIGVVLLLLRRDEKGEIDVTYSVLLTLWFIGSIYAALKGIRFTVLVAPAFSIAFGAGAGLLYQKIADYSEEHLHVSRWVTGALVVLVLGFAIVGPTSSGSHIVRDSYSAVVNDIPIMNDAWWNVLTQIKTNSTSDAIINSWWDFGHHFKYVADRRVTFDGASQNGPQAHAIGKVLQTDDEIQAIGYLRLLDCGGTMAYDYAINATNDPYKAISLVEEMVKVDKDTGMKLAAAAGVPAGIEPYIYCTPPEDYFIASEDMVGKSGVWAHFGLWDFKKAEVWQKWKDVPEETAVPQMAKRFNWTTDEATQVYNDAAALSGEDAANNWIGPFTNYLGTPAACQRDGALVMCGNGVRINLTEKKAEVQVSGGVALAGKLITYDKTGKTSTVDLTGGNDNLAVVIWPDGADVKGAAMPVELAQGMFTRMFYMNGLGLKFFKPFTHDHQLFGGDIFVYKVDWNGSAAYIPQEFLPKDSIQDGAQVKLSYIGWTDNNTVFDSSIPDWRGKNVTPQTSLDEFKTQPLSFTFGKEHLIPGFEKQITGMKANESKTITIAPADAYGTDAPTAQNPLGNQTLHFKLRVESVQ